MNNFILDRRELQRYHDKSFYWYSLWQIGNNHQNIFCHKRILRQNLGWTHHIHIDHSPNMAHQNFFGSSFWLTSTPFHSNPKYTPSPDRKWVNLSYMSHYMAFSRNPMYYIDTIFRKLDFHWNPFFHLQHSTLRCGCWTDSTGICHIRYYNFDRRLNQSKFPDGASFYYKCLDSCNLIKAGFSPRPFCHLCSQSILLHTILLFLQVTS